MYQAPSHSSPLLLLSLSVRALELANHVSFAQIRQRLEVEGSLELGVRQHSCGQSDRPGGDRDGHVRVYSGAGWVHGSIVLVAGRVRPSGVMALVCSGPSEEAQPGHQTQQRRSSNHSSGMDVKRARRPWRYVFSSTWSSASTLAHRDCRTVRRFASSSRGSGVACRTRGLGAGSSGNICPARPARGGDANAAKTVTRQK